ncbi:peptidoglycan-binding protein [Xanthobacter sp. KR7-65]|uniref:peptidoglycan-binding domain-containing protein n=1 Tax=Xanthobacter sp. KR7-65 TaxID=3156612 RepID=UPI0032B5F34A
MKLEPVMEGAPAQQFVDPAADDRAREARRLRRLDFAAAFVAIAGSGAFLANILLLQAPPPGAPLPAARPAGIGQSAAKTNRTTVPLAPSTPTQPAPAGGATTGSLGYLSIRTTVTGTAAPLVPATAAAGRTVADAHSEPPPRRPPASLSAASDVTGAVRPPADIGASPRILSVQKALAKLGYGPLKVDGLPGGATRSAVQRFQRDRNLPADGEISDRVVRELAAVSGMAVN